MFKKLCLISILALSQGSLFAKSFYAGDAGTKRLVKINEEGKVVWEINNIKPVDLHVLENGNVLYCHSNKRESHVREVTPSKEVVWEYKEKGEIQSCQRLSDGTTLIGHTTEGVLRIVNSEAKVVKTIQIQSDAKRPHSRLRIVRKGSDGLYYVAQHEEGIVRAYDESGKLKRELEHLKSALAKADKKTKNACYSVQPLADGSVLTAGLSEIKLFNAQDEMIWNLKDVDIPEVNIYSFTGTHVLDNGNIAVANYLGHGAVGKGHHYIEVNRDKKVVWSFRSNDIFKVPLSVKLLP